MEGSEKVEMTPGIRALWREGLLLDFTIEVEDQEFKVHKVVMAGLCDYFKAMFRGGMKESQEDRVRLEGFSALAVSNLIQFIYTSQFGRHIATPEELMKLAMYLQFPRGIEVCEEYLYEEINRSNCFSTLALFQLFSLREGIKFSVKFIKQNFDAVLKECEPDTLPLEDLVNLMDCWNRSEWELFELTKQWLEGEGRKQHVDEVMTHVRFPLMSPTEVTSIKDVDIYTSCAGSWCEVIDKALAYHSLPTYKKVMDDSDQTKVRSEPTPVCFPADYDFSSYLYCQRTKPGLKRCWENHDTFNSPEHQEEPFAVVAVNNFLIVFGDGNEWNIFDPRTLTWSLMAAMGTYRKGCAVVYHEKFLYAMGGASTSDHITDIIQKYDFETNTWTVMPSKLPVPLYGHTALSIAGAIYVTGGFKSINKGDFSLRMDSFDPSTDTWKSKAPMTRSSKNATIQLMELYGDQVIFVLDENLSLQYYQPASNEWSVWHGNRTRGFLNRTRGIKWHIEGRIVASKDYLYLLNFIHDDGVEEEDYRGACVRWEFRENGPCILEVSLGEFPICEDDWDDPPKASFCALLMINHLWVKKADEASPKTSTKD